jgi:hypothetical protein
VSSRLCGVVSSRCLPLLVEGSLGAHLCSLLLEAYSDRTGPQPDWRERAGPSGSPREIFDVCEMPSMPPSRGGKKAAQRRPTSKPASLICKRSSSGLLHQGEAGERCHPAIEPTEIRWEGRHLEDKD